MNEETVNQETNATFTQDDLDRIVGERLSRERAKYADYDALREKAARLDQLEEASKTELQKAQEKAEALQQELDGLKQAAEIRKVRDKVSQETGVPANLLTASTEEDCKAQAEAIKAYAAPAYPEVKDGGEVKHTGTGSTREKFRDWFESNITH